MGKTYEELMAGLSSERRKRVEARAAKLVAEERSLRDLRQAHNLTQQRMAKKLGVKQHSISRLEQRSDMLLSTLRDYIGKMGGELVLTARFPDREPVKIKGFADIASAGETRSARRSPHAAVARPRRASQSLQGTQPASPKGKSQRARSHPVA
ncbi:MAG: helix-turn-helix domain-containing protein [Steroidobacteraceae bacterium]